MPVSSDDVKNASGLTSSEKQIIQSIKELYTCKPTDSTYEMYTETAVFHDPIGIAEGVKSIRAQFNGLAKLFPRAEIPKLRVLENPPSVPKSTLLIDQDVSYYRNPQGEPIKTINSLLTIETNDQHKVTRHTEEWNHRRETSAEDGFMGMLNEGRKKFTANFTGMFVSQAPPEQKNES
ncbi:uncharacterized protein BXZ73DRAFT_91959 [Epithele typhae]|uniref:uncharacterized protein n=1 Tax=Epithele typhae TaxID=378194 RepID=UPI002007BEAE|nr:uncharacterized protein BXZ73DRAFT_91959 [Epithele typhae]KAH9920225.1 hypothetical protein BXZ73DRAFT_91959 [Epithele typhae]